jgi:hypothetical protein
MITHEVRGFWIFLILVYACIITLLCGILLYPAITGFEWQKGYTQGVKDTAYIQNGIKEKESEGAAFTKPIPTKRKGK